MYVGILALLIWKLGWKKGLIVIAAALVTFGLCDQVSNLVKHAVGRIRPLHDGFMVANGLHILEKGGGYSFFSAHAANAFGLACSTFVGLFSGLKQRPAWMKWYGGWMFFWSTMVSISRIFVGKHYLGDVLVGILVGAAFGLLAGYLASFVMKRIDTCQSKQ